MLRSLAVALSAVCDLVRVLFRSRAALIAENLFLRRQLALYLERKSRRRRPTPATKFALVILSRFFPWTSALAIVKPDTFACSHRAGFRLCWRWNSRYMVDNSGRTDFSAWMTFTRQHRMRALQGRRSTQRSYQRLSTGTDRLWLSKKGLKSGELGIYSILSRSPDATGSH